MADITQKIKSLNEISIVALDIMLYRFPGFVYGQQLDGHEIPCFCFHSVEPESFEAMLQYLNENNYETLSIETFYDIMVGKKKLKNPKSVLLTFDDGTGSMWTTLYPLLKKYDKKATVFLVPGRIEHRKNYLPNLDDVWGKRAAMKDILNRDESDTPLATWEEIQTMHESGLIDFESHTLDHSLIFSNPKIVDFVNPSLLAKFHPFEFPVIRNDENSIEHVNQLGMPLYTTMPRMSDHLRFFDDNRLRESCNKYVEDNGGRLFFEKRDWKHKLIEFTEKYRKETACLQKYETREEQSKAIFYELKRSKELIERHLSNKRVRHLCYPWGVSGTRSVAISRKIGYLSNFSQKGNRKAIVGKDVFAINRISDDFFYCLPGKNRDSLVKVLKKKIVRRAYQGSPYLSH